MKKILALLCAMMLLCGAAYADTCAINYMNRFELRAELPAGWHYTIIDQNDTQLEGSVLPDNGDPARPQMNICISFNDSLASVSSLGQLDTDALESIKASFSEENAVSFDMIETASGISLLMVRETGEDQDFLDFYTIWEGHEIDLTLFPGEGSTDHTLTEEQLGTCLEYVRALEIGPIAE